MDTQGVLLRIKNWNFICNLVGVEWAKQKRISHPVEAPLPQTGNGESTMGIFQY
jgi:hypothetical protein